MTLDALADPTRRRVFERLRRRDRTVGELAAWAGISQPAASQHLRVLRQAGLVTSRAEGTRRYYRADPRGLDSLRRYIDSFWDDVLAAYARTDDDPAPPPRRSRRRGTTTGTRRKSTFIRTTRTRTS
jgi:DNA-binding transcriptional ArsR family regulator